ncbi:MAG: Flp family type IVb pilin [Devosia sp.]|jgi:pilus assembly protein Flp/PilA|uniref:Flp family type IVb pilin n=1 Tax=unclassified Devosia TaxID=196773 RepID=UPI0019E345D3|nr:MULTISPECIES: Flp family type IVb pilin [unclassified Devosia]MBF0679524.1 Flp family type IVb pilin [Devosia sp.]WEJ33930.1 Flp family type IVb pilin [Devosia sp. SD17-2]
MRHLLGNFCKDESGATAIEYALVASLIAVAIVASLMVVNERMVDLFGYIESNLDPALRGQ